MSAERRYHLQADSWLSGILGRPAWIVAAGSGVPSLAELRSSGPHLATAKLPVSDTAELEALQALGFRVIDTALTLDAERVRTRPQAARVRFAAAEDRAAVEAIAGNAFRFSRFHLDRRLPRALADKVKASWAGNWFAGRRGDGMVVSEDAQGAVAGFLQLRWAAGDVLVIDLIAVGAAHERKGLASAMIGFAQGHGTGDSRRPRGMLVGTQAANVPSLRLYESLGFRVREASYVLHHHGDGQ